jgi:hypothetical protein
VPHVADPCGSLCRSAATTAGLFAYRAANICQSLIQRASEYFDVYHRSPSVPAPALERWWSSMIRSPIWPAWATILSMICKPVSPCRSGFFEKSMPFGLLPASNNWFENGSRMVLNPSAFIWSIIDL